jgi:hypothetical protein
MTAGIWASLLSESPWRQNHADAECVTKAFVSEVLLKNLPSPLFAKEGEIASLWQREGRRDFIINVFILMIVLLTRQL